MRHFSRIIWFNVLVGNQIDFPSKVYAADSVAGGAAVGYGPAVAVNDLGRVYFSNGGTERVVFCEKGQCKVVLND